MIRKDCINKIIVITMVIAVFFTLCISYLPKEILSKITEKTETFFYETELFNKNKIITIDIQMQQKDWDNMIKNAIKEEYSICNVTINNITYYNVGIRPKGNTSLTQIANDDTTNRYSFKLDFDKYISGQTCNGLDKLILNNIMSDTSYMKEYFSYDIMNYIKVPSSLYSFVDISVNGKTWGLYLALEGVEESFAQRNFGEDYGQLYKPESDRMGGGGGRGDTKKQEQKEEKNFDFKQMGESSNGADLSYIDDNADNYSDIFSNTVFDTKEEDYQRVIEALKNLKDGTELEKYINVDECLRYFAANSILVNQDSYFGTMLHNYYLYEENGQLSMLPWDYNLAFGGFGNSDSTSSINQPIDPPVYGADIENRPIVKKLLEVEEYNKRYHQYLEEIIEGYFESGLFEQTWNKIKVLISDFVKNDPTAFYTYEEFETGAQTLLEFASLRAESIKGQLNGTIPSTKEGQQENPESLITAENINIADMGTQGGGRRGEQNFREEPLPIEKAVINQNQPFDFEPPKNIEEEIASKGAIRPRMDNRKGENFRENTQTQNTDMLTKLIVMISSFIIILLFVLFLKFYKRRKYFI